MARRRPSDDDVPPRALIIAGLVIGAVTLIAWIVAIELNAMPGGRLDGMMLLGFPITLGVLIWGVVSAVRARR